MFPSLFSLLHGIFGVISFLLISFTICCVISIVRCSTLFGIVGCVYWVLSVWFIAVCLFCCVLFLQQMWLILVGVVLVIIIIIIGECTELLLCLEWFLFPSVSLKVFHWMSVCTAVCSITCHFSEKWSKLLLCSMSAIELFQMHTIICLKMTFLLAFYQSCIKIKKMVKL